MGPGTPDQDFSDRQTCTPPKPNPNSTQYPNPTMSTVHDPAASHGQSTGNGPEQRSDKARKDDLGEQEARQKLQALLEQASREAFQEYVRKAQQDQQAMGASQAQNGAGYQIVQNGMMMGKHGQWVQGAVEGQMATLPYSQKGAGVPQKGGLPFVSNHGLTTNTYSCLTQLEAGQQNGARQPLEQGFANPSKRPNVEEHQVVQKGKTPAQKRQRTQVGDGTATTVQQTIHQHHSHQQDFGVPRNGTEYRAVRNAQSSYYQVPDQSSPKVPQGHTHEGQDLFQQGTGSNVAKNDTKVNGKDQSVQNHEQSNTALQSPSNGKIGNDEDSTSKRIASNSMPSPGVKAARDAADASFIAHFNAAPAIPNWPQPNYAKGRVSPSSNRTKTICILASLSDTSPSPSPSPAPKASILAKKTAFLIDWDLAFFYSPLITFFYTITENTYLTPYPLPVRQPTTGHLLTYWIYTQTIYPCPAHAAVPHAESQAQLVDLWLVGESLQIPKLQNQALRELVRIRNETKTMSIDAVRMLYANSAEDCLLRKFFVWQYATRLSMKSVLEKKAECLYPNRLLLEWIVLLDRVVRGSEEKLDTWTVDKFFVEEKIVGWCFGNA